MRKIMFLLCLPFFLFSYEDLGQKGHMYDIVEEDFMVTIKNELKKLDIEALKQEFKQQIIQQATGSSNLPLCRDDNNREEDDYLVLKQDLYTPTGRLYQKKGTKVLAPLQYPLDLCFVDGSNLTVLKNQIDFFDKKTDQKCIYLVKDRNILNVHDIYPNRSSSFFPVKERDEKRFNVSCYPSMVHLIGNTRTISEHSYEKFKN